MTLREFGYSLERWGVSLLEWFVEFLRVFFWQTSWLDASIFMLFWVVFGYLVILGIGNLWATQISEWMKDSSDHQTKYNEDDEYRREYDAKREIQKQELLRKTEELKEPAKNAPFYQRNQWVFWFILVVFVILLPILE